MNSKYAAMREVTKTVQLQRSHFLFWSFIVLFVAAAVFFIEQGRYLFADEPQVDESYVSSTSSATYSLDILVTQDGRVLINNQPVNAKVFQPLSGFDEFKYKVVDKPKTFIDSLSVKVHFAGGVPDQSVIRSFAVHGIDEVQEQRLDDTTVEYYAAGIGPEAVYTIVAQLPRGTIDWSSSRLFMARLSSLPVGFWLTASVALPLLTLGILFAMFWPALRSLGSVHPDDQMMTPPEDLPPAIVGILVNGRVSAREIAATLLDLAQRGYLTIYRRDDQHFSFAKRRSWQNLRPFELLLLTQIFKVKGYKANNQDIELTVGETLFSPGIAQAYVAMYDAAADLGYFKINPAAIHRRYRLIGLSLFFIGLLAFSLVIALSLEPSAILFLLASMMTVALIIIVAADSVPLLTMKGETARREWLAFRHYLRRTDLITYTEGAQAYYEKYLGYAVVLKSEVPWVNRFRQHPFYLPSWYDAAEKNLAIEDFARGLYQIIGAIAELFSSAKEPTVH